MAKKIQKKQIEDGVFVETKSTYSAPTQDNEFVQKKYVDEEVAKKADVSHTHSWADITNKPRISVTLADTAISRTYTIGLTGANGSSGKLIIPKAVSWNDVTDKPTFPTLPNWVTQTKPTYDWSDIQNKPEFNYLPLSGGMITPTENAYREGIRIGNKDGWSLVMLGAIGSSGTTENSWTVAKKSDNSFQISNGDISGSVKKGLNLTATSLIFSDNSNTLLEVTNELVHTNKVFDAPYIRIHQSGSDYISLNSKDYKLNVKVGSGNRDSGEFKPVLASGYEVPMVRKQDY